MYKNKYKRASTRIAKRNQIKRQIGIFFKIGLPVALLVGLIFLLRAEFLQVRNLEVLESKIIPADNIKNTASNFISGNKFLLIPKSNILLLNKKKLTNILLNQFTRLERVEINKQIFSKTIKITAIERSPDFLWCSETDECFFMTQNGFIFEKTLEGQASSSKIIFGGILKGESSPLLKNFATPERMQNYLELIEVFKRESFEIYSVNIESSDKAIAKTNIGDVFFSPEGDDLSLVAENIILLFNKVKNENPSAQFNYIDARFGNKFYYKLY